MSETDAEFLDRMEKGTPKPHHHAIWDHDMIRLRALARRGAEAAAEIKGLRCALLQAQDWFQEYGNSHQLKGDTDKAARNYHRADFCRIALDTPTK